MINIQNKSSDACLSLWKASNAPLEMPSLNCQEIGSHHEVNTSRDTREVSSSVQSHHANRAPGCALLWDHDDISRYQRETGFQNSIAICAKRNVGWHHNNRLPHEVATALPLFQAFISEQPVWVFVSWHLSVGHLARLCPAGLCDVAAAWLISLTLKQRAVVWEQLFQACFTTHIQSIPSISHAIRPTNTQLS